MIHGTPRLGRSLIVILTIAAWLSISNHCVLGGLIAGQATNSVVPTHCHGNKSAPSKGGDEQTPCCKILKAITVAKVNVAANQVDFAFRTYPTSELIVQILEAHTQALELDTGPPRGVSFSESVLQRSILAHAPPFSLS